MAIFHISSLSLQTHHHQCLSFSKSLTSTTTPLFLQTLSLKPFPSPKPALIIRMGGGPRTFPGGVSKWQWKRMQAKKAKQLLKARLTRERQIYEMRKRAELKAAVSDLERPWELVEKPPALFSVSADEQVKVLADRFQKPGGFDLWTDRDGPQLFHTMDDLPSARFFPKGVVHSIRPYRRIGSEELEGFGELGDGQNGKTYNGKMKRKGKGRKVQAEAVSDELNSVEQRGQIPETRGGENRETSGRNGLEAEGGVDRKQRERQSYVMRNGEIRNYKRSGSETEAFDGRSTSGYNSRGGGVVRRQRRSGVMGSGENRNYKRDGGMRVNSLKSKAYNGNSSSGYNSRGGDVDRRQRGQGRVMRSEESRHDRRKGSLSSNGSESEVFDMWLREDGSYEFQ